MNRRTLPGRSYVPRRGSVQERLGIPGRDGLTVENEDDL